jgi:hypothetical protein
MYFSLIAALLSIVSLLSLLVYAYIKVGMTKSISAIYDELNKLPRPKGYLYTIGMWLTALPLAAAGETELFYIAGALIALTGLAADIRKSKLTEWLHIIGAWGGMAAGLMSLWYDYGMWELAVSGAVAIGILQIIQVRNVTYWSECAAFAPIAGGIMYHLITVVYV